MIVCWMQAEYSRAAARLRPTAKMAPGWGGVEGAAEPVTGRQGRSGSRRSLP